MFRAVIVEKDGADTSVAMRTVADDFLMAGDVDVAVTHSSINYKDGLASIPSGGVARVSPLIPGIDFAGVVVSSRDSAFSPGDEVIGGAGPLGVSHHGGLAEQARVPATFLVPMPDGLDTARAMAAGTAGMTAAMAVARLEHLGVAPGGKPVLVTGASGGVGTWSIVLLADRGFEVHAATGKEAATEMLRGLGAAAVVSRLIGPPERMLGSRSWAGAIDAVGGPALATVLAAVDHGGAVVTTGNTGGMEVPTTVAPFILRGVTLTGIDSASATAAVRARAWHTIAAAPHFGHIETIGLDEVPAAFRRILEGQVAGRIVVAMEAG